MGTSQKCTVRSLRRRRLRRKPGEEKSNRNIIDEKKHNRNLFDSQNLLREKNLPREQVVEEEEKVSDILTLRQKKRQEEKIRFENKMNII